MPHIPDTLHDAHDLELVAAYAAGDAEGPALDEATALVASCTECAALHHDLRAIAAAMPELPAPARPRDFRLTPEQAASLRPGGIRGLLAAFSGPRFAFATPLGTGLAALGIVGILVASGGFASGGASSVGPEAVTIQAAPDRELASDAAANGPAASAAAGAAPAETPSAGVDTMGGAAPAPSAAAASEAPVGPEASEAPPSQAAATPAPSPDDRYLANAAPSPGSSATGDLPAAAIEPGPSIVESVPPADATTVGQAPIGPWPMVATAALLVGLGLVSLRWVARRAT
ncbi:MAG TPA: hypothetical protein VFQ75_09440 [Candidatus Limnocylindrales bacterium]|nr:hypothetical protein [Candidatus Limnocylindrales bacterium]